MHEAEQRRGRAEEPRQRRKAGRQMDNTAEEPNRSETGAAAPAQGADGGALLPARLALRSAARVVGARARSPLPDRNAEV
eukprot:4294607-Pleurochrysis_carterae.AAC.1